MSPETMTGAQKLAELLTDAALLGVLGAAVMAILAFMRNVLHIPARVCAGVLCGVGALVWFFFTQYLPPELQEHILQKIALVLGMALQLFHWFNMKKWFGNTIERAEARE